MQGITRNPLADSGLLGINGGATLAIALCFAFGIQAYNQLLIMSFIGAALATITVFGISSTTKGGATPFRLTLAGAVISALLISLSQGVALYFNLSQDLAYWSGWRNGRDHVGSISDGCTDYFRIFSRFIYFSTLSHYFKFR